MTADTHAADAQALSVTRHTGARRRSMSLGDACREFRRHASPWIIAVFLVGALSARLLVGGWTWVDGAVVIVTIAIQPFVEWVIHTTVLHWRPRRIAGVTVDPLVARKHRAHHVDPRDVDLVFIPTPVLLQVVVAETAISLLVAPRAGLGLTYLVMLGIIGLVYEWTHFLIHSDHRPTSQFYRRLWTNHRLHHYKNEQYWFTITNTLADHILRTAPDVSSVPTSPTVRDLLGREQS